jgi:hypothetical protein
MKWQIFILYFLFLSINCPAEAQAPVEIQEFIENQDIQQIQINHPKYREHFLTYVNTSDSTSIYNVARYTNLETQMFNYVGQGINTLFVAFLLQNFPLILLLVVIFGNIIILNGVVDYLISVVEWKRIIPIPLYAYFLALFGIVITTFVVASFILIDANKKKQVNIVPNTSINQTYYQNQGQCK